MLTCLQLELDGDGAVLLLPEVNAWLALVGVDHEFKYNNSADEKGGRVGGVIKKDIPRIELGLLDSKSNVLTITPYVLVIVLAVAAHLWPIGS